MTRRQGRASAGRPAAITLRARHVLPVLGRPLDGGWVRIERGRIVAVGRRDPPHGTIDLGSVVLLPGLVNAHTHLEFSSLSQPLDVTGGLPAWIGRVVAWRRNQATTGADVAATAAAIRRGLAESLAAGVTTIGEIATAAAAAAGASYVGGCGPVPTARVRVFREGLGLAVPTGASAAAAVARALDLDRRRGLLGGVSPHAPYSVAAPLGRRLLALARARGLPVAMHLAESLEEQELLASGGGALRTLLGDLGAWPEPVGPDLLPAATWIGRLATADRGLVIHGTHLGRDTAALDRLARHRDRLGVVVCPRTTRALSGRLPPVGMFREAGVRVALGTDGRASNPDLSILAECRALEQAGVASATDVIRMATHHGAWALGLERRCGAVTPGRVADLVMIRPPGPWTDPAAAVLDPAADIAAVVRRGYGWRQAVR